MEAWNCWDDLFKVPAQPNERTNCRHSIDFPQFWAQRWGHELHKEAHNSTAWRPRYICRATFTPGPGTLHLISTETPVTDERWWLEGITCFSLKSDILCSNARYSKAVTGKQVRSYFATQTTWSWVCRPSLPAPQADGPVGYPRDSDQGNHCFHEAVKLDKPRGTVVVTEKRGLTVTQLYDFHNFFLAPGATWNLPVFCLFACFNLCPSPSS